MTAPTCFDEARPVAFGGVCTTSDSNMSSAPLTDVRESKASTENGTIGITAPTQAVIHKIRGNASGDVVYGRPDNAVIEDAGH